MNSRDDVHESSLLVTPTGNVEDEPGSKKLYQILLADFHARQQKRTIPELMTELRDLKIPTDGSAPRVKILEESHTANVQQQHIKFESDPGIWLDATLYLPASSGRKPAVLVLKGSESRGKMSTASLAEQIAAQGRVVLDDGAEKIHLENVEGPIYRRLDDRHSGEPDRAESTGIASA